MYGTDFTLYVYYSHNLAARMNIPIPFTHIIGKNDLLLLIEIGEARLHICRRVELMPSTREEHLHFKIGIPHNP